MTKMSHVDKNGQAKMVDVGAKATTSRTAKASGLVHTTAQVVSQIKDNQIKKGDVLSVARIAGILAAKRTSELIPLCHPLQLDLVSVDFELHEQEILVQSEVRCTGKTGVEMEALTAVSVACLTLYDMCKSLDRSMRIASVQLDQKTGGKSGTYNRETAP